MNYALHSNTAGLDIQLSEQLSECSAYTIIFGFWTLVAWLVAYLKFRERTLK